MNDFDKLELNTETIRELTGDELDRVAGGGRAADAPLCSPDRDA